jgi:hypothetical protein
VIIDRIVESVTIELHVLAGKKITLPRLDAERGTSACEDGRANDQE